VIKAFSLSDLPELEKKHKEKMDAAFEYDESAGWLTIKIAYPYDIELARIKNKSMLLTWILHLCEKRWMNTEYLSEFIEIVCKIKGWNPHLSM